MRELGAHLSAEPRNQSSDPARSGLRSHMVARRICRDMRDIVTPL